MWELMIHAYDIASYSPRPPDTQNVRADAHDTGVRDNFPKVRGRLSSRRPLVLELLWPFPLGFEEIKQVGVGFGR